MCFFCAEWALSFPCWFESRVCVGHPCRWFSISVTFDIRIASKESVMSVYGVNETLFSVIRWLDWLKKQTSTVKKGINLSSTQEGYVERAKTDSSSDWCFPLSHPVSFLCLEKKHIWIITFKPILSATVGLNKQQRVSLWQHHWVDSGFIWDKGLNKLLRFYSVGHWSVGGLRDLFSVARFHSECVSVQL